MDILALLKREGFSFSKKYGQNFITDFALLEDIACDAEVNENDTVVEIGAGAGTLTTALARKAKRVISFEIDRSLEPILSRTLAEFNTVELIFDDITCFSFRLHWGCRASRALRP